MFTLLFLFFSVIPRKNIKKEPHFLGSNDAIWQCAKCPEVSVLHEYLLEEEDCQYPAKCMYIQGKVLHKFHMPHKAQILKEIDEKMDPTIRICCGLMIMAASWLCNVPLMRSFWNQLQPQTLWHSQVNLPPPCAISQAQWYHSTSPKGKCWRSCKLASP